MPLFRRIGRGIRMVGAGSAGAASAFAGTPAAEAALEPKRPGETKVVAVMGDYWHNGVAQELEVRKLFSPKKDWRVVFVRASRFFTPELLADTDLLITARYNGRDSIGWSPEGLVDTLKEGDLLWTDENVGAIIENVRNRGMGYLALHCTIFSLNRDILNLLDVEPVMHREIQPIWVHSLNEEHPITEGIGKFFINLDEQFAVIVKSHYTTTLFKTTALHDKREAIGGWCLESGKGRIVGLLPGHTQFPYRVPEYRKILWRAAHWAMKRDIPPYPG